jgi:hypothetical protein
MLHSNINAEPIYNRVPLVNMVTMVLPHPVPGQPPYSTLLGCSMLEKEKNDVDFDN